MKSLKTLIEKLPKASAPRVVLESALKGMAENERQYQLERSEFERRRDERRRKWAERHPTDS